MAVKPEIFVADKSQAKDAVQRMEGIAQHADLGQRGALEERLQTAVCYAVFAQLEGRDVGYAVVNMQPKYGYYKAHKMPEIQDLNVRPDARRQGIGEAVVRACEAFAQGKGYAHMGIAVGLTRSYGAAQRLYIRLGYRPDGMGVTYDRKTVGQGEIRPIDDALSLMLLKGLRED